MRKPLCAIFCAIFILMLCVPAMAESVSPEKDVCSHLYGLDHQSEIYEEYNDFEHNVITTEFWKCVKCGHIAQYQVSSAPDYHYLRVVDHGCYDNHHIYELKCDICPFSVVSIRRCMGNPHIRAPFLIRVDISTGRTVGWVYASIEAS